MKKTRVVEFTQQVRDELKFLDYAPVVFVSALTGSKVDQLFDKIRGVREAARRRVPTGELNRFLATLDLDRAPAPGGRPLKIRYLTQVSVSPPSVVVFTNRGEKLHFSTERYLINQLRRRFDFAGTPIVIRARPRRPT